MMDEYLTMYFEKFGEGFPMYQLGRGRNDDEVIAIIKSCIEAGKDVYEMGLIPDDNTIY